MNGGLYINIRSLGRFSEVTYGVKEGFNIPYGAFVFPKKMARGLPNATRKDILLPVRTH